MIAGHVNKSISILCLSFNLVVRYSYLCSRYCHNIFDRDYKATIGVDFEVERFEILGQEFSMQMYVCCRLCSPNLLKIIESAIV